MGSFGRPEVLARKGCVGAVAGGGWVYGRAYCRPDHRRGLAVAATPSSPRPANSAGAPGPAPLRRGAARRPPGPAPAGGAAARPPRGGGGGGAGGEGGGKVGCMGTNGE